MRAVHGSTVLYPSDANQAASLVAEMVDRPGIVFLRTTREKLPVLYEPGEPFPIGGARVVRSSPSDQVTLVGAGITLHQALAAAELLAGEGIAARVVDLYSVKPVDEVTLREAAAATGRFITVEDHWPEGGLGDAVLDVFAGDAHPPAGREARGPRHARIGHADRAARARPASTRPPSWPPRATWSAPPRRYRSREHPATTARRVRSEPVDRLHRPPADRVGRPGRDDRRRDPGPDQQPDHLRQGGRRRLLRRAHRAHARRGSR